MLAVDTEHFNSIDRDVDVADLIEEIGRFASLAATSFSETGRPLRRGDDPIDADRRSLAPGATGADSPVRSPGSPSRSRSC